MPDIFRDDEAGYHRWLLRHPAGFVINTSRQPTSSYLILHLAECRTISEGDNFTTTDLCKVCSDEKWELTSWARDEVGGAYHRTD